MMQWLMKNEGYPPAVIVSVLLHGLLLLLIIYWDRDRKDLLRIEQPATIVATAVKENPQRVRQQETKRKQQQQATQERERVKEQERQHQEKLASEEAERQKLVQQVQQQKEQQKQQQKQQELDQKRKQEEQKQQAVAREDNLKREKEKQQQAAKEEAQRQAEQVKQKAAQQRALTEEQQLVAKYQSKIQELIESYWNRPAGARKDTVALVELQLLPTGERINYRIIQGSGDDNFDRSVLMAVGKAENFSFMKELDYKVFDRYFRKFTLEFKPGDLP